MSVKMIFGYIRVSTKEQKVERQINTLVGCERIFIDRVSGKSADRPELNTMKQQLREGDTVRVKSVDRLARNTQDLLTLLSEITEQGVKVEFIDNQMGFDNNLTSKFMITLLAAVAELERSGTVANTLLTQSKKRTNLLFATSSYTELLIEYMAEIPSHLAITHK